MGDKQLTKFATIREPTNNGTGESQVPNRVKSQLKNKLSFMLR